ncbi:acyl-CoA dehydrogenase family protein [Sinosporangium album]|nr:acyl-CoA dehydrogenase family protein [Sinosporangium album]
MSTIQRNHISDSRLTEPVTPQGRALLDLISPHLPQIRAGAADNDRNGTFPVESFEALREDGVLGATVPTELGGLGVQCVHDVALALLHVAQADGSTALALHMQLSRALTLTYDWAYGPPATRALAGRLLKSMGSGEAVVPTGVKDIPRNGVRTVLTPDGAGGWLLSGGKTLVSLAPMGTDFVVFAVMEGDEKPARQAAAVLPRETPGFTVLDNWDGLGMRASGSVDIVFDNCRVPGDSVFHRGPIGQQDVAALAGMTVSSINMLGIYTGLVQAARDIAVETVARRGSPPAGVSTLVAEIDARLFAVRSTAAAALAAVDRLLFDVGGDMAERGRRMMTPFQHAKLVVNRLGPEIVNDCLVLVGGASYSARHPLARLYRDVRAFAFMHPFTYANAVDYLSGQAFGRDLF